jgi:hypothetical protein
MLLPIYISPNCVMVSYGAQKWGWIGRCGMFWIPSDVSPFLCSSDGDSREIPASVYKVVPFVLFPDIALGASKEHAISCDVAMHAI